MFFQTIHDPNRLLELFSLMVSLRQRHVDLEHIRAFLFDLGQILDGLFIMPVRFHMDDPAFKADKKVIGVFFEDLLVDLQCL